MPDIAQLPDVLVNRIAAGEVIERPSSVVKELVENALDAGATEISVDLSQGGKKSIVVKDNGCGIKPEQLKLSIHRHTTSKIKTLDDLDRINTMGFRGEALASMASIAKLKITSRSRETQSPAHEIEVEGGEIIHFGETGHDYGTTVSVKYLFHHTPARLKFLKSNETELSHISDFLTKCALINPQVGFKLFHDDKKIISVRPTAQLKERVRELFGADISEWIYPISHQHDSISVTGFAGHPQLARSHQRDMYLFVNGRPVRDKVIFHALIEAYRNLLMHGKYPFVIVNMTMPHEMVDVNVHPAKTEVRFVNGNVMHRLVTDALRKTLAESPWFETTAAPSYSIPPSIDQSRGMARHAPTVLPSSYTLSTGAFKNDNELVSSLKQNIEPIQEPETQRAIQFAHTPFGELTVIGQLSGTYILCQGRDKLVLIDQHAAHERVGFEKLLLEQEKGGIHKQNLLIPETFDLNPSDAEVLKQYLDDLKPYGLDIDHFGGNTFVVRAYPSLLQGKLNIKNMVLDFVGEALERGRIDSLKDKMNHVLATMACHAAVRAHDVLGRHEMEALLKDLDQYHFTSFCPHGRPVMVEVTEYEIQKWFKRIV
ncbi:DNA mismatch repair endonuclease MutL [bacterium]|nr:DNA mismatch repair endonuclease MutL [bacterium]